MIRRSHESIFRVAGVVLATAVVALAPGLAQADQPLRPRVARAPLLASPAMHKPSMRPQAMPLPAAAARTASQVQLEVRDTATGKAAELVRFVLPLSERGTARIEARASDVDYKLQVEIETDPNGESVRFGFERRQHGADQRITDASVRATVRMKTGQRVVIARIERPDGSRTEVAATMK